MGREPAARGRAALARGDAEAAAATLAEALGWCRGAPLAEFAGLPFAEAETARLQGLIRSARADWATAALELGRHAELVDDLERWLAHDRFDEPLWAALMLALYRSGRQADALAAFGRARRGLVSELGVEPGPDLRRLEAQVLRHEVTGPTAPQPAIRATRGNLPERLTSFVGREAELAHVGELLARSRLVTLSGPGGCGKTSLAVRSAAAAVDAFPDGIWFADLSAVERPNLVPGAVAGPVGVREEPGRSLAESVAQYLGDRRALVVLDNCEHLLDAAAAIAEQLLRGGTTVRVLATSRERLSVPGEASWTIPSLSETDAVRLFLERAQDVGPGEEPTAVAEVCRRLDGMPLAIELAAARTNALTVAQIAARLDDAVRLLGEPSRALSARQQTLRATIEWSYQLLPAPERTLFDRLAVFVDGFTLEAAEAVGADEDLAAADVLNVFTRLVDKSLVLRVPAGPDGCRYRLLETLRQYGWARLGESGRTAQAQEAHARWFLDVAEQGEMRLFQRDSPAQQRRLSADAANFHTALTWAFAEPSRHETGARLVAALGRAWFFEGLFVEAKAWTAAALAATEGERTFLRGRVLHIAALLAMASDLAALAAYTDEVLAIAAELPSSYLMGQGLSFAGLVQWARGNLDQARSLLAASVEHDQPPAADPYAARALGPGWISFPAFSVPAVAAVLGRVHQNRGEISEALGILDRARTMARSLGNPFTLGVTLDMSATLAFERGNLAEAAEMLDEALRHYRASRYQEGIASALNTKSLVNLARGDLPEAAGGFGEAVELCRRIGHLGGLATALEGLASVAPDDWADSAARLLGAADALRDRLGAPVPAHLQARHRALRAALSERLGPTGFSAAWTAGQALTLDETVSVAAAVATVSGCSAATQRV